MQKQLNRFHKIQWKGDIWAQMKPLDVSVNPDHVILGLWQDEGYG